jgi:hypothetical protein
VLSSHAKLEVCVVFQTGSRPTQHERNAESSFKSFPHCFHSASNDHLSPIIAMIPYYLAAIDRFDCRRIHCRRAPPHSASPLIKHIQDSSQVGAKIKDLSTRPNPPTTHQNRHCWMTPMNGQSIRLRGEMSL